MMPGGGPRLLPRSPRMFTREALTRCGIVRTRTGKTISKSSVARTSRTARNVKRSNVTELQAFGVEDLLRFELSVSDAGDVFVADWSGSQELIAGKSFGGYLAAWAIGQTRAFRAKS
jgi:hypothetical protein